MTAQHGAPCNSKKACHRPCMLMRPLWLTCVACCVQDMDVMFEKDFLPDEIPPTPVVAVGAETRRAGSDTQSKDNPGVMYINIEVRQFTSAAWHKSWACSQQGSRWQGCPWQVLLVTTLTGAPAVARGPGGMDSHGKLHALPPGCVAAVLTSASLVPFAGRW